MDERDLGTRARPVGSAQRVFRNAVAFAAGKMAGRGDSPRHSLLRCMSYLDSLLLAPLMDVLTSWPPRSPTARQRAPRLTVAELGGVSRGNGKTHSRSRVARGARRGRSDQRERTGPSELLRPAISRRQASRGRRSADSVRPEGLEQILSANEAGLSAKDIATKMPASATRRR